MGLVHGIGFNDNKYPSRDGDRMCKEYDTWRHMLFRCTKKLWDKRPTYTGTVCSENFKSYSFFYAWCQEQVGFDNIDEGGKRWHLDKDLLLLGNKLYSEDTCVFVPLRINNLLTKRDAERGDFLIGVDFQKSAKKYRARCCDGSSNHYIGLFCTQEEAFSAYKLYKESLVKQVANEYKEQIDSRAYQALINYNVNITD